MGDEPPPLPPKLRTLTGGRYSDADIASALKEEKEAYERIHREKLGRSQSQKIHKENGIQDRPRSQTPTPSVRLEVRSRPRPTPSDSQPPIPKRSGKLSQAHGAVPKDMSCLISDSWSSGRCEDRISSTNDHISGVANGKEEHQAENDLMSFNSPEKAKNDLLEMLQSLNKSRSALVPVVPSQSTGKNAISHTPVSSVFGPVSMCPSTQPCNIALSRQTSQPWNPVAQNGAQYFANSSSKSYGLVQKTNVVGKVTQASVFVRQSQDNTVSSPQTPPVLPQRCPVLDLKHLSTIANQLSIPGSAVSSSITNTIFTPAKSSISSQVSSIDSLSGLRSIGEDLIDLRGWCASSESVLEVFDPLILKEKEERKKQGNDESVTQIDNSNQAVSVSGSVEISSEAEEMLKFKSVKQKKDDEVSYYEQVDPFEYMYAGASSTRSDPIHDIYDGLLSPGAVAGDTFDMPPPLPPRPSNRDSQVQLRKSIKSPKTSKRHGSMESSGDGSRVDQATEDVVDNASLVMDRSHSNMRTCVLFDGKTTSKVIHLKKIPKLSADDEARAFWENVRKLRNEYIWSDHVSNPGLLLSPCLENNFDPSLSVKLAVFYMDFDAVVFTCSVSSSVEHVIMNAVCELDLPGECGEYILKVRGIDEYLAGETTLGEYEYVHTCVKHDLDVAFTLMKTDTSKRSYLRTEEDDMLVDSVQVEDLLTAGSGYVTYFEDLSIIIETFERELSRLHNSGFLLIEGNPIEDLPTPMRSRRVRQVVKQLCASLGEIETTEMTDAINTLVSTCRIIQQSQGILDGEEDVFCKRVLSTGSYGSDSAEELKQLLLDTLSRFAAAVNNFLIMYSRAFRVDYTVEQTVDASQDLREITDVREQVAVRMCAIHRLNMDWKYDEYFVEVQLMHGSRNVGHPVHFPSQKVTEDPKFYPKVIFDKMLDVGARVNTLPRESRLVFTVFGIRVVQAENKVEQRKQQYIREELGWAAVQLFSFDGYLAQGKYLLTIWPICSDRRLGPAPYSSDHPHLRSCPVISLELTDYGGEILFPKIEPIPPQHTDFGTLGHSTQQQLMDIIEQDIFTFNKGIAEEREILWEKRHYLHEIPAALAKVLLAAHSWDCTCLPDLHSMVKNWTLISPVDALHLLLPCFPDSVVRGRAVEWIRGLGSDEMITFLPQLVQAVKHEAWDVSPIVELLLERAITSPRLAHHLYWLLNQCLPLQTNMGGVREVVSDARYSRRLNLVTKALMRICGKNMENRLLTQEAVLRSLYATAMRIKDTKDNQRMNILKQELEFIHKNLEASPTSLPLSPALEVAGVELKNCSYFTSFTVPLKLAFLSSEPCTPPIVAIFKVGDDLRQDMLVIQMINLMDKLWLKDNLDLKIVTFSVVPTGDKIGIIELVKDAETLRKIQIEYGVTGSFQDRPIAEWLAKQNPSQLEYQRAVENFTASCAGYCVATYILGICDRHNDNIMLKTTGHLFHIDFGKFLGDAQKFGNFKRDRTPFVLTSDMAYVINGGEKPSDRFQSFVDLCCQAFNIIRKNGHLLVYLFALMASSGIPGVTWDAVIYVEKALLPDQTNAEAAATFARMIQESLKSWFTQVNFFIHNLAQLRFSGEDTTDGMLLSFIPKVYTMSQDGRIQHVSLYSYQKRYNPNKYYVYILKVERENQREPSYLFRSYREFSEFHQKLCCIFPLARIHSLPKGVQIGRSEVKAVAEKRKYEIELFLRTLFDLMDEIAHSDIVYTFFHPLLRDEEDTDIHIKKLKDKDVHEHNTLQYAPGQMKGQVKVSIQYLRGQLQIMVQHARNLSMVKGENPSPYVKLYLLPDPQKKTKRKTKVLRKTCHPTFMEQITYRMSQDIIKQRILEVSIWSEDKFNENVYLGSAYLKLSALDLLEETCEWLSLEHRIHTARGHMIQHTL
ncbi:phosphatidylinositol-4-phosphate 3-kinase catalytic subunit Pi3K68D isoform X2 [Oratosquilla oratoria]|uniref:phosphatidylinositol-4-phosphate 3-kinase catalytic subunit Pi3K68D isoform X2 n=1 Tax=Oratosquilla oratoria TaxID=337810 RepID=UPI003F76F17D